MCPFVLTPISMHPLQRSFQFTLCAYHVCYPLFEDVEYYLSDSSGLPTTTNGEIVVHKRDGSCESHTWTLRTWLNVSGIRYQS